MEHQQTLTLGIGGMTCAACVGRVERALTRVPGVAACSVNLATESAQVTLSEPLVALTEGAVSTTATEAVLAQLSRAVRDAGYEPRQQETAWQEDLSTWQGFGPVAVGLALSLPLTLPMWASWLGYTLHLPAWVQFALATPVQWVLGARFYVGAWHALRNRSANMDVLVALGTTAAWGLSVWLWWATPSGEHAPHLYFEGAAMVMTLVCLGKWLEARIKRQTTAAIRALHRLRPAVAHLEDALAPNGQGERDLPVAELRVGDVLRVRAGEAIPADAVVVQGHSSVHEAMLTGEPLPVPKAQGDAVTGGSLNGEGFLRVRVQAVGADSMLARIIARVEQAQAEKAPIQRWVDRVSEVFVPVVLTVAVCTLLAWWFWGAGVETAWVHAVSVLVIACPCAMGLATPTALVAGTGLAAANGILIRDAQVLELAHAVQTVVFDKTGTLTRGEPVVAGHWLAPERNSPQQAAQLWALALGLQMASDHPLAKAVVAHARAQGVGPHSFDGVEVLPGRGVRGQVAGQVYELSRLSAWQGLSLGPAQDFMQAQAAQGATLSALVRVTPEANELLMLMAFADVLKPEAVAVVQDLRARGLSVLIFSGDHWPAVWHVAQQLGLPSEACHASLSPEGKADRMAQLCAQGHQVAFVGDGINDAPALAAATVGVAMASAQGGSDVVLSTAGLTLLRADLRLIPLSLDLSTRTLHKIRQNLFWAFVYNVAGIPLAALGVLSPMVAGAAMAFSSVSVMLNSASLRRWSPLRVPRG